MSHTSQGRNSNFLRAHGSQSTQKSMNATETHTVLYQWRYTHKQTNIADTLLRSLPSPKQKAASPGAKTAPTRRQPGATPWSLLGGFRPRNSFYCWWQINTNLHNSQLRWVGSPGSTSRSAGPSASGPLSMSAGAVSSGAHMAVGRMQVLAGCQMGVLRSRPAAGWR